jgi:hypothetical protein
MKVTDPWKRLLAAVAAGGMYVSGAAYGANLNTNLMVNGDFELVDTVNPPFGAYNAPRILNWIGTGVAYSHDASISNGAAVPDYANGADPPGAGHWFFTPNGSAPDVNAPNLFYQDINVAAGDTGNAISSGFAGFNLSAYMSSYSTHADIGRIQVEFRSSLGASLGTSLMSDSDAGASNVWSLNTKTGVIPIGTSTVRVSAYGTAVGGGGPDGYMDNVDFQVAIVPLPALRITVNRANGAITLSNDTGGAVNLSSYSITSAFEGLAPANWLSITDNYDAGNPGPNQVDAAHSWSELTDPNAHGDLSEADLQSGDGASLANGRTINLSSSAAWIQNPNEDLAFQYISSGQIKDGIVSFVNNSNNPFVRGDLNIDGSINVADWVILRTNQLADLSTKSLAEAYRLGDLTADRANNHADFVIFKSIYDAANGAGAFVDMASAVPEPTTTLLVLAAGTFALPARRRRWTR